MKVFFGCLALIVFNTVICRPVYSESTYKKTMAVIDDYSETLEKEKGIINTSYGFRWAGPDKIYDGKIHTIALGYKIDKRMKYEEARKLFYEVVDGLLIHLNKNEKIRNYFYHYPLTYEDLEFHFSLDYHMKGYLKRDDVDSIHIGDNEICYFIVDKESPAPKEDDNKEFNPNMFPDFLSRHRSIVKKLPEKD